MKGCPAFKGLHIAHHDRVVDLTANELREVYGLSAQYIQTIEDKKIQLNWFTHLNDTSLETVLRDSPNTPNIVVVDILKTIVILEV